MSTKNWKRIISMMLCIALLAGNLPAISAAETSGTCGNNLSWTLDSSGTLTVTGSGDMYSYYGPYSSSAKAPWFDNKSQIKRVQIEAGVTSVGNNAFNQCTNLTQVSLPTGISIGEFAFYDTGLTSLVLPEQAIIAGRNAFGNNPLVSVTIPGSATIYDYSFQNCKQLTQLSLGEGMTTLVNGAFKGCSALQTVTIPSTVSLMETIAFDGCTQLQTVTFTGDMPTFESNVFRGATLTVYYPANNQTWDTKPTDHGGTVTWIATCGGDHDFDGREAEYIWSADNSTCTAELTCGNAGCQVKQTQTAISAYQVTGEPTCIADGTGTYTAAFDAPFTSQTKQVPITTPGDHNVVNGICTVCRQYGTCGDNLIWTYQDGTLTITGTGEMKNYAKVVNSSSEDWLAPWYSYRESLESVVIGPEVQSIGNYAFYGCSNLQDVLIPEGVISIGDCAFSGCSSMSSIEIPESVTNIGHSAFYYCSNLTSITIPNSVTAIYYQTFFCCERLQTVTIPDGVTYIGTAAFMACRNLQSIIIPDGVTTIEESTFQLCNNLTNVVLPQGLKKINNVAFYECTSLEKIIIPSSVFHIDTSAFSGCSILTEIAFVGNAPSIESNSFTGVTATVYYPAGNETWTEDKLQTYGGTVTWKPYCTGEHSYASVVTPPTCVSDGYTTYTCSGCGDSYVADEVPANENHTGEQGEYCTACGEYIEPHGTCGDNLTWVLDDQGTLTISGQGDMYDYIQGFAPWYIYQDQIASVVIKNGVTSIGDNTFLWCSGLGSVVIPEGVTNIGEQAFCGCSNLGSVVIPEGVTSIGDRAFQGCSSLGSVTIPKSVTGIGVSVFSLCDSLTSVTILQGVTSIGNSMFWGCDNLTSVTIPGSVTSIGEYAFWDCYGLTSVTFTGDAPTFEDHVFSKCNLTAYYPRTASGWTAEIMQPYGGTVAWKAYCLNDAHTFDQQKLEEQYLVSEATCTKKALYHFSCACGEEGTETFEHGEINAANHVFDANTHACDCGIYGGMFNGSYSWTLIDGTLTVDGQGAMGYMSAYNAPWYVCRDLITALRFTGSITTISDYAFQGCKKLSDIELPESITQIGANAFQNCAMAHIDIPSAVTSIGDNAFSGCAALTEIVLPENLTSIGAGAFRDCSKLQSINIPSGVKEIKANTFYQCYALRSIILPEGFTSIGASAFYKCSGLAYIYIPKTVTTIGEKAFQYSGLWHVLYAGSQSEWANVSIGDYNDRMTWDEVTWHTHADSDLIRPYDQDTCTTDTIFKCHYGGSCTDNIYSRSTGGSHSWQAATCTTPKTCSACGVTEGTPLGHVYDQQKAETQYLVSEATCTEKAVYHYSCACGEEGTETFEYGATLEHVYDQQKAETRYLVSEATCTEKAVYRFSCACGKEGTETFEYGATLEHVYDQQKAEEQYLVSGATCTEKAVYRFSCACGKEGTETFEYGNVKPHTYESKVTAPTCTEGGYTTHTCAACGDTYTDTETAALGHDWKGTGCTRCDESRENPFVDVPENSFFIGPVLWAVEKGITNGVDDTHFGPDANCMRAAVVTFLWRAAGEPEPTSANNPFTDVKESDYFYKAVLWAVEKGITNGMTATTFGPTAQCNRAQVVTFLWRAMGKPAANATEHPFTDVDEGQFYFEPMLWAVENGITNGLTATTFGPTAQCNRAQVVTFLYRTYNK